MKPKLSIYDLLMIFCIGYSLISVALLSVSHFDWQITLAYTLIITIATVIMFKIDYKPRKYHYILLAILVVALIFRYEPYLYVMGGQDEGIYVMMSEQYSLSGSPFVIDPVRSNIENNITQNLYDIHNQRNYKGPIPDKYEGNHLPGLYIKDLETDQYVFQFYPLHPLWMSLASGLLGQDHRIYSLVFFSLITIISFFLIARELTGKEWSGYIIAFLLAINPLHAYFSKFPVTEITALAFSSASFYYLLRYYKNRETPLHLVLSAGLIACFFFTRITGFLYIPFFYILLLLTMIYLKNPIKKELIIYFISIFGLYALSVLYGMIYSFPYSHDVYRIFSVLGGNYYARLALLLIIMAIIPIVLSFLKKHINIITNYIKKHKFLLFYIFLIVILYSLYKTIMRGYTEEGFEALRMLNSNLFVVAMYLGPLLFLAIFPAVYHYSKKDAPYSGLLMFLIFFAFFKLTYRWTTNYNYYYARYTLTELVPFFMLISVMWLWHIYENKNKTLKVLVVITLILTSGYFIYFSSFQFQGAYAEGADEALSQIKQEINHNDLLIFEKQNFYLQGYIYPSLKYYYDINTFLVSTSHNLLKPKHEEFLSKYKNIYILSQRKEYCYGNSVELIKEIQYKMGVYQRSSTIPTVFEFPNTVLRLYKVKGLDNIFQSSKNICLAQVSKTGFYDNTWTNGTAIIKNLDIDTNKSDKYLLINTNGWNPEKKNIKKLNISIEINDINVELYNWTQTKYYFTLPETDVVDNISINSNTFIPKEYGINDDTKPLGLDIKSISIVSS